MHRAPLLLEPRRLATVTLLALASCAGEAATPAPPVLPASPPTDVFIAAPTASTSAPPAAPAPTTPVAPAPAASAGPPWIPDKGYAPSVQLGNSTKIGAAALVPFAHYLNQVHQRIHPIFSDQFLASLAKAPPGAWPADLHTDLELVIEQKTGKLKRMGVVRSSGSTLFDVAALDSVQKAQPFGPAPEVIASPDGNVYIHWEFHRDPIEGCTTRNAWPYMLKSAP